MVLTTDPVTTDRLSLPLWTLADVSDIRARRHRPEWHPEFPREDDVAASTLWSEGDPWGPRSIVRGATVLGSIGFFGPPLARQAQEPLETEVGYGLVTEAHGWGFATEALRGLLRHTDEMGVRIRASVLPENAASLRVLAKCGFTDVRGATADGEMVLARPVRRVDQIVD